MNKDLCNEEGWSNLLHTFRTKCSWIACVKSAFDGATDPIRIAEKWYDEHKKIVKTLRCPPNVSIKGDDALYYMTANTLQEEKDGNRFHCKAQHIAPCTVAGGTAYVYTDAADYLLVPPQWARHGGASVPMRVAIDYIGE